jgi:type I restriction enzyme S subunit
MRVNYQYIKKQLNTYWDIISCRDEFSIESGSRPKGGIIDIKEGILSLGGEHIDRKKGKINFEPQKLVTREFFDSMTKGKVKNNDILINKDGAWTGKVGLLECGENEMLAVNEHNFILRAISINQKYAFYFFFSELGQKQIIRTISGSAQPGINSKFLKDIYIPIPPISEQQKIAEILSTVDDAIEKTAAIIEESRQLKKGLMQKLFTEGIGHTRFKETKIGRIPEDWEIVKLEDITTKVGSGITPRGGSKVYLNKGIPFIRSQNVLYGQFALDNVAYISNEQHHKMKTTHLHTGDVLLNISGASIGRSAVVPDYLPPANVNQHVCIIRLTGRINPQFISTILNAYNGQKQIFRLQAGGNREGLNFRQIRSFKMPIPPLSEQNQIASILTEVDAKIEKEEATKVEMEQLKKGLMQILLTGKVRVKA